MPRRNYPPNRRKRRDEDEEDRPFSLDVTAPAPPGWTVKIIQPARAVKEYRCPGCNHEIRPGTLHVVAWREGDDESRRHWHKGCWESGAKRLR